MAPANGGAVRLARRLRELRLGFDLTQAELAVALRVASATLSSWESLSTPKTPPPARLDAYALFFATRKSLDHAPHLVTMDDLDDPERKQFDALKEDLRTLRDSTQEGGDQTRRALLYFEDAGPVVIICPEAPPDSRGPLADETNVNHTRLHKYADIDALIELFGHTRALNPTMHVLHRLSTDVQQTELQNHLVVLGGVGWNPTVRRILSELKRLPIMQVEDDKLKTGDVFRVKDGDQEQTHFPVMEEIDGVNELVEDLALLARLPNPFNSSRTLTICNGVHSRGVVGAVLTVTDETVRPANEKYLAKRFPTGDFAMLVRVPVVSGKVLAPDLQNPRTRVFEWAPDPGE